MMDKKVFGTFIREKRTEKGLTQRELAERLSVSESAVSKWEMAKSYPDITMIPDLCQVLEVSERELIAGAVDTEYRRMKREARLYQTISETFFWGFTIAYGLAMVICLICDLIAHHIPTFSVLVFGALLVAFSFVPTWTRFTREHKLAVFVGTTYCSMVFLFLLCCLYNRQNWFGIASAGVLLGYVICFGPFLLKGYLPERVRKYVLPIYFGVDYACLLLLLLIIRITVPYSLWHGVLIALYTCIPFAVISVMHLTGLNAWFRAAVDVLAGGLTAYGVQWWVDRVIGGGDPRYYRVDFADWKNCVNGNVAALVLLFSITAAAVLAVIGVMRKQRDHI